MVAYTSDFCLPYLEGSDSPCLNTGTVCDPSSAWCDLIALVEAQLDAVDAITGRTGMSIPLARISYRPSTPTVLGNATTFPFDIVDADTDDMVDLALFNGVIPRRNGVYEVMAEVVLLTSGQVNPDESETFYIRVGNEGVVSTGTGADDGVALQTQRTTPVPETTYSGSAIWNFTDSTPLPRTVFLRSRFNVNPIISASLTVLWHSEAV